MVERYDYEDYGRSHVLDPSGTPVTPGTLGEAESAVGNPFRYTGRRFDPETGLTWYRTRYYDPRAGRFTSRDTIGIWGDPANLGNGFTYVGNNPWSRIDPFGETWWGWDFSSLFADEPGAGSGGGGPSGGPQGGPLPHIFGIPSWIPPIIIHITDEIPKQLKLPQPEAEPGNDDKAEGPFLDDPRMKPPGYDPETWKTGVDDRGKPYSENPEGKRWRPHHEDPHHWPHYDGEGKERYPRKYRKPRSNQKKKLKPNQTPTNPWDDILDPAKREIPPFPPYVPIPGSGRGYGGYGGNMIGPGWVGGGVGGIRTHRPSMF